MKLRILTEASGSMTSGYIIQAIQQAGHVCVASDIDSNCTGKYLADDFVKMPDKTSKNLWSEIENILIDNKIDVVLPSLDETLLGWAERKENFKSKGIKVIISDRKTIATCQDKWNIYNFFVQNSIPTPNTSLSQVFELVKPRLGRGSVGVQKVFKKIDMSGMVSQEFIHGIEYTVDVFCDRSFKPVYIIPRRRVNVREGKSTAGITENQEVIIQWCRKICKFISFVGPINIQCFLLPDNSVIFIEINPRIAGGMALGFASSENWINLIVDNILNEKAISLKKVMYGMEMRRYYAEVFIPSN